MFKPTTIEMYFIGYYLEGFFYGVYSGVFVLYLQHQALKKENQTQNITFYSICALYVLSTVVLVCDIAATLCRDYFGKPMESLLQMDFVQVTLFGCADVIAQFILIYRCWIVWGHNIRVVIIPSILTIAFLGTWLASNCSVYISSDLLLNPYWAELVSLASLALSLAVNALVTGLIVFRIFKVFRKVEATSEDHILGVTGGSKLRHIIFILIESGMALFSIQLARLVTTIVGTDAALIGFEVIVPIHEMLNGITPTIILVRTSMGLSFHDEKSMEEVAIGSLRFASSHPNSRPEMGSIESQESDD